MIIIIEIDDDEATVTTFEGNIGKLLPEQDEQLDGIVGGGISVSRRRVRSSDDTGVEVQKAVRRKLKAEREIESDGEQER